MCGIAGILYGQRDRAVDRGRLTAMCDAMAHRGPDDYGLFFDGSVGFGHRRLSIIDIASGQQPMTSDCGLVTIVFNGEIYNYRAIRKRLINEGFSFRSNSDTEVILNLYLSVGVDCVKELQGMFAFALWDAKKQTLFVTRDRVGIKPLYYAFDKGKFVFGSELKTVMASGEVDNTIDYQAVDDYFAYGFIRSPRSIFRQVCKCLPGTSLVVSRSDTGELSVEERRYWTLPARKTYDFISYTEAKEELERLLLDAVKCRLMSEVPLGAFLSGGIDSSTVVWLMSRASGTAVNTFSIGFDEENFNELPFAKSIASRFGTHHEEEFMTPNAVEMLPEVVASHDEPFGDPSSIPTWYLCRMARKHVTVALSGDGGDELLAGYARYVTIAEEHRRLVRWPTLANQAYACLGSLLPVESRVRNKAVRANLPPPARYAMFRTNFNAAMRRKLLSQEVLRQVDQDATSYLFKDVATPFREDDGLSPLMACDFATYLPDDVLTKVDRMSMAHSLEARVPLLDHRVVEFLQTLPISYLFNRGRTKNILRDIIEPHLPQEVLTHRKQGFSVPLKKWFKNELREQLEDAVEGETFRSSEIFNHRYVKRIFDLHQKDRFDLSWQLWQLMIFSRWYQNAR